MKHLPVFEINARWNEQVPEDDNSGIMMCMHDCHMKIEAADISEAIDIAKAHLGLNYVINAAECSPRYDCAF